MRRYKMNKIITVLSISAIIISAVSCGKKSDTSVKDIKSKSGVEMVSLPGGEFIMGDGADAHKVKLSPFHIDKYEVTQEMFKKIELPNPSHFKGDKYPVEMVAWVNAAVYCNERSLEEGLVPCYNEDTWECNYEANGYRLPTEAEWEYAARAGSRDKYFFGNEQKNLKNYAIYSKNSSGKTAPAGSRKPNPWGLYDMYGNVAEWCNDVYAADYYKSSPSADPRGPKAGKERVLRGGSWNDPEEFFSSAARAMDGSINDACILRDTIGFRCVRKAD
jgi:formylglycine-generating enzyme required for sulfatase activity